MRIMKRTQIFLAQLNFFLMKSTSFFSLGFAQRTRAVTICLVHWMNVLVISKYMSKLDLMVMVNNYNILSPSKNATFKV